MRAPVCASWWENPSVAAMMSTRSAPRASPLAAASFRTHASVRGEARDRIRQAVAGADRGQLSLGPDVPSEDAVRVRVDRVQEVAVAGQVLIPQPGMRLDGGSR